MNTTAHRRFDDLPTPQQAGILCNDPRFQAFAAIRSGLPDTKFNVHASAEFLRDCCGITSRAELKNSATAKTRFQALRTSFDAWTGKIASPR